MPKKFGHKAPDSEAALAALDVIAANGLALDFNTAGWRKPVNEAYPSPELTREAAARGVPFVLGSDAHAPGEVGWRFGEARALLNQAGAELVTYKNRERQKG